MTLPTLLALCAPAFAADAPITVLDHRLEVSVEPTRVRQDQVWTVRVDDPARAGLGVTAPVGLDGATDKGASVQDGRLVLPPNLKAGATFTLRTPRSDRASPGRGASGQLLAPADLPVVHAEILVQAPAGSPLSLWSDANGRTGYQRRPSRIARVVWDDLPAGTGAQAVWTTWSSWEAAGGQLEAELDRKLATRKQMGPGLANDVGGMTIEVAADRVYDAVRLDPERESWDQAASAVDTLDAGHGSAVDRGIVLLSLLEAAGHEAHPAWYRPLGTPGVAPSSTPAPTLLDHPAIAVQTERGIVWIDPGAVHVEVPNLPVAMLGATAWVPGDLPYVIGSADLPAGRVSVQGQLRIADDRSGTFSAAITATEGAEQWLRERLAPLSEDGLRKQLEALVRTGRPELERLVVTATGLDNPRRPLKITVQGKQAAAAERFGQGVIGHVPPILAPELAGFLPSGLSVHEEIAVVPPQGLLSLSAVDEGGAFHPDVALTRSMRREAEKVVLITDVERPDRVTSPARDDAARAFLDAQAPRGAQLALFGLPDGALIRSIRADRTRPAAELAVVEAFLWWNIQKDRKARKALQRGLLRATFAETADQLARYTLRGSDQPWRTLLDLANSDNQRLRAIDGLERAGLRREAWLAAVELEQAEDLEVRAQALLVMERLQEQVSPEDDEHAAAAWREPDTLLDQARAASEAIGGAMSARIRVRLAERALAADRNADAEGLLAQALQSGDDPAAEVLLAVAGARAGVPVDEVRSRIEAAVARAPFDAEVVGNAARAVAEVGLHDRALSYGLAAARLANGDPRPWDAAVDYALAGHHLGVAVFAARRASDLDPASVKRAERLAHLATLARDQGAADVAAARAHHASDVRPSATLDDLMGLVEPEGLLALLLFHDAETVASQTALDLRAQLQIDAGRLEQAGRDGSLLAHRFGVPRGTAIAFAAGIGRQWSPTADDRLDAAAERDVAARAVRMEHRLLMGAGDAVADARKLPDEPRAQIVARTASDPAGLAAEVEGWDGRAASPSWAPSTGFSPNKPLSAAGGVSAWSDPERRLTVVRIATPTGSLPPPLANLFTPAAPPLRSLSSGGQVVRLDGGPIPLYAAIVLDNGHEVLGLGYTPDAAERALDLATRR